MPIQAPQWTEVLSCPVCYKDFNPAVRQPVSLSCGHTVCRTCLGKLHRLQCPFDQAAITREVEQLPTNYAILQLVVGPEVMKDPGRERVPDGVRPVDYEIYHATRQIIEELALYLNVLTKATPNGTNGSLNSTTSSSTSSNQLLSRPIQRKLVTLVNCQLVEDEGRARAVRAARSLGERIVTELIIQHQNPQQLSTNLWAAVRARGCQFLGPAMQEETLRLVLLALEDGAALSRKVLVMFVVQKLELQFPQASKTSVGHVVQLLYRASCFKVTKREEESSLMQLKEEFRNYEALRREHDAQIVQIAIEAGLRISPEQWSSLLYGDLNHKSHMQSIIDKLQTPASFASSIQELTISLQRSGDPVKLSMLRHHLEKLAGIDPSPEAKLSSWTDVKSAVDAVKKVLQGLVNFVQNYTHNKKSLDVQSQNIKYKTSMCRDIAQKGGCPRGPSCTFAHSEDELEKYRAKSRHLLSVLNGQTTNQRGKVARTSTPPGEISLSTRTSSVSGKERPVLDPVPRVGSAIVPGPGGDTPQVTSPVVLDDEDDWEEHALPSLAGLKARSEAASRVPKPKTELLHPRQHMSDASLYSDSSDKYPSRGEELRSTDSPPPSAIRPPHHPPPSKGSQDSGHRYSSVPSEDGYLYDPRAIHNAQGYNHPHDVPRKYQQPVPPPPTKLASQPQVLIPTSYHPSPRSDDYGGRPGAKHNYPYIMPSGGRYAYPTSPTHPRQIIYGRPAHRYVDPHTLKTYDVVPTQDYVEPSAPPQSLLPSRDDYEPGSPWPYDAREFHPDAYYDQQQLRHVNVPASGRPLVTERAVAGPGKREFVDAPDREEAHTRKKSSKPLLPPVVMPPSKLRPKEDNGPSLNELKERKIFIRTILDDMETGKDSAPSPTTQSSSSTSQPYTSIWPTTPRTSSPIHTTELPVNLQFEGISDDDDDDNDHRKNGIDYDDDVQLLSNSMKLGHEDDEDTNDRYGSQDDRQDSLLFSQGSYNPWTSTALFTPNTGKAVKETPTNYTMTYSKVLVRHVSANENEEQIHKQPLGTHAMQDFESMSMADLQRTLQDVKQQDQRAGCGHHERSSKIQLEMIRRVDDHNANFPLAPMPLAPLPAQLVHKEPILHGYTKYTQANPDSHWDYSRQNDPVARMARSMGRNTVPIQINAGMSENTTPVTITQDCQVAPGVQAPHGEGYYVLPHFGNVDQSGVQPTYRDDDKLLDQVNWEKSVNNLLENTNPNVAVKKLNRELDQVERQIHEKESAKNAHDVFIVNREETALGNMYHKDPRAASIASTQLSSVATQMQDVALTKYHQMQPHDHGQQASAAPPRDHRGQVYRGHQPGQEAVHPQVESDKTIAKMLAEDEQRENLKHLREAQRRAEKQRAMEQLRRQQERQDRDLARQMARQDAMAKGYYYTQP